MTGDVEEFRALRLLIARSNEDRERLLKVVNAMLMFHRGGEWTVDDRAKWTELTGATECTTKSLCDFARAQLATIATTPRLG